MAIIGTNQEDENNPQAGAAPGNTLGGGSGFVGGGSGQGATTKAAPAPTSSGSYTNLSAYLGANQGAGQQMGQQAEKVVDTAGQKADAAIGNYAKVGAPGASDANRSYQALQDQLGRFTGNQSDTASILRNTYTQPNYSAGESGLDAFLVNQGGGADALNKGKVDWGGEGDKLKAANATVAARSGGGGNTVTPTTHVALAAPSDNIGSQGASRPNTPPPPAAPAYAPPPVYSWQGGGQQTAVPFGQKDPSLNTVDSSKWRIPGPAATPPPATTTALNNTPMGTTGQAPNIPQPQQPYAGVMQQLDKAGAQVSPGNVNNQIAKKLGWG